MEYKRRVGRRLKNKPEVIARELLRLKKKHGLLNTQIVLDNAASKDSPLHIEFEWNDTEAARKFRQIQAANLITSISIHVIDKPSEAPKRMFIGIYNDDGKREWYDRETIMQSRDLSKRALECAFRELEHLRAKYEEVSELTSVWDAIDKVKKKKYKSKYNYDKAGKAEQSLA